MENFSWRTAEEMDFIARPLDVVSTVSLEVTWASPRTELVTPLQTAGGRATLRAVSPTSPVSLDAWHVFSACHAAGAAVGAAVTGGVTIC